MAQAKTVEEMKVITDAYCEAFHTLKCHREAVKSLDKALSEARIRLDSATQRADDAWALVEKL